jgi:hypothetical protein
MNGHVHDYCASETDCPDLVSDLLQRSAGVSQNFFLEHGDLFCDVTMHQSALNLMQRHVRNADDTVNSLCFWTVS